MINYNWRNVHITMLSNDFPGGVLKFDCFHEDGFQDEKKEESSQSVSLSCGQTINAVNTNNEFTFTLALGYGTSEEKAMVVFYQTVGMLQPNYSLTVIIKDDNDSSITTYPGVVITKPSSVTHKKDGALDARTWEFKAESRSIVYY
ncbi:Uncharacterised protein [Sebaldella termitidis]|uniref:Uncharacterized protein n=1 Tax=Sebaldella termitidis (strain ATCC 33386 / NCTC 11300) TaxID=526218 RepID=D1AR50_SEBTE|nr:hypothetical protein [Sebaldella termitidis]ACZ07738.1 hypothetical protein Sterm_0866 [Sebaldella termitidis ATCC 33386]SUI23035.1 Uncharacterised protein [Sebaldella termitidis]